MQPQNELQPYPQKKKSRPRTVKLLDGSSVSSRVAKASKIQHAAEDWGGLGVPPFHLSRIITQKSLYLLDNFKIPSNFRASPVSFSMSDCAKLL